MPTHARSRISHRQAHRSQSPGQAAPVLRLAGAVGMLGMIVVHALDLPEKQEEAPYMAALFELLIVGCAILTPALLVCRPPLLRYVWMASGALALLTIAGFVASRTVGLPRLEDHVGDWANPVGIASLFLEAMVIAAAALALRRRRQETFVSA